MHKGTFLCTNRVISSVEQSFWYQVDDQIKIPAEGSPAITLIIVSPRIVNHCTAAKWTFFVKDTFLAD